MSGEKIGITTGGIAATAINQQRENPYYEEDPAPFF